MSILDVVDLIDNWSTDEKMKLITVLFSRITGAKSFIDILKFYEEWIVNQSIIQGELDVRIL